MSWYRSEGKDLILANNFNNKLSKYLLFTLNMDINLMLKNFILANDNYLNDKRRFFSSNQPISVLILDTYFLSFYNIYILQSFDKNPDYLYLFIF